MSHPAPRRHAVKLRHGFVSPAIAVPPAPTFTLHQLSRVLPAACAIRFAHGFVGYARRCPVSAAHRFRACPAGPAGRERPPATVFRLRRVRVVVGRFRAAGALAGRLRRWSVGGNTAARPSALRGPPPLTCGEADGCDNRGVSGCKIKTVPPAALRIHSAATRQTQPRPTSFLLHSTGRTRPRQTRCAGLPVKSKPGLRFASVGLNPSGCSLRSIAHRQAGVNSPLRVEL